MAAKFFTGLPLDGPDPECVKGNSETALAGDRERPGSSQDHSHTGTVRNAPVPLTLLRTRPVSACDESPSSPSGDRRTSAGPPGRRPTAGHCSSCRSAASSSTARALPLTTDTIVAEAVTGEAAARLRSAGRSALVAPAVAYGASGEHEDFAGTVSIGHEALGALLVELGRSASRWASGVVFVNGHGGNAPTVASAVDLLRAEGRAASWAACAAPGSDAHAGLTETSLLLHVAPEAVRVDLLEPGDPRAVTELMPDLRSRRRARGVGRTACWATPPAPRPRRASGCWA